MGADRKYVFSSDEKVGAVCRSHEYFMNYTDVIEK